MQRNTLRSRIAVSLFAYSLVLATAVLSVGFLVNEDVEQVIWAAILEPAMERHLQAEGRLTRHSDSRVATYAVRVGEPVPATVPKDLAALPTGFRDETWVDGREVAVLVNEADGWRDYVVVDITDLERSERNLALLVIAGALLATVLLVVTVHWFAGRLVRPVTALAREVDALDPTQAGARLPLDVDTADEMSVIGGAVNRLLERITGFVNRERTFINTVSHELRTPIAVIAGATDVALSQAGNPTSSVRAMQRIRRATRDIDHLITTLLILAKSPERLLETAATFRLDDLVRDVVADHTHLTRARALTLEVHDLAPTTLRTAERIAQIAISNLVRNAIEHSDLGVVRVSASPDGIVTIQDPGHGMGADDVSRIYGALARGGDDQVSRGIGLELIARICEHLGWSLDLRAQEGGTCAVLDLSGSVVDTRDCVGHDTVADDTPPA